MSSWKNHHLRPVFKPIRAPRSRTEQVDGQLVMTNLSPFPNVARLISGTSICVWAVTVQLSCHWRRMFECWWRWLQIAFYNDPVDHPGTAAVIKYCNMRILGDSTDKNIWVVVGFCCYVYNTWVLLSSCFEAKEIGFSDTGMEATLMEAKGQAN